jgi:hypothetical protein
MGEIVAWVTHGFRARGVRLDSRLVALLLVLVLLICLLAAVRLLLASCVTAAGRHLQDVRDELSQLQRQNATLEIEVAGMQAAGPLLERAQAMGLRPAAKFAFIDP